MKTNFVLLTLAITGNHTALGFGHASLNSLNSKKVILGKTQLLRRLNHKKRIYISHKSCAYKVESLSLEKIYFLFQENI